MTTRPQSAKGFEPASVNLGDLHPQVAEALAGLQGLDIVGRIWRRDHTVWSPDPREISDRLGWLTVTDLMRDQIPTLESFANEVREAGFRNVVLLGMGGSSLGPEVLRQTFGSVPGYPELIVLDTTVPAGILAATKAVDPAHTLFLISSKSGGTIETLSGYSYFRSMVAEAVGSEHAGQSFVAITDPGTPVESLARKEGFRRTFLNPPDIGGRYSVLSYFGLVPAALIGMDLTTFLDRADGMRDECASFVQPHGNPGAWLGTVMGVLAEQGLDKVTLVLSPSIGSFGMWVEQLIAESTGKQGRGIVPVAGEPFAGSSSYGTDRLFVYMRVEGDRNAEGDAFIKASRQPVVRLDLRDLYDLGAEFFRWEFATAVAGSVLNIHPFDQPNVQLAKEMTGAILDQHQTSGQLPVLVAPDSISDLWSQTRRRDYLAIMAYLHPTPETDRLLARLRGHVMEMHRVATTLGYGPRFLHSTGQLHKGGPDTGLFLQITAAHQEDIPIPGVPYTFGTLADAQALGDLQVLQQLGRRVIRVQLGQDYEADLRTLVGGVA